MLGFSSHDHRRCVSQALKAAESYCQKHNLRFTPVRQRTLGILLENHAAMGAYDVLERLKLEGLGSKPPIAYRALSFLLENGFIHRIERLNAFVACAHPGSLHQPAFLICSDCGSVAETPVNADSDAISNSAEESGFQIKHTTIEAEGRCPGCLQQDGS